jgi:leader peptidase (prepilin peptidase)/N-methyltransferase
MTPAAVARAVDAYVLFIGACAGSFLNVVIARVPAGRSIVSPPSSCPKCGQRIKWHDNVPLLSWLLLRGKCRSCGQPISARYPLVELLTALLVFAVWRRFGAVPAALGYSAFVCALVALTYIDVDTWLLPHQITWPLLAIGLASPLWNAELGWSDAAIGAAAGFAVFAAVALFGEKVLKRETMGWGDVWLLAAIGAWLGWRALFPVVLLSALQGSLVGIVLLLLGRGPAEKEQQARAAEAAANAHAAPPADVPPGVSATAVDVPAADEDWVPPPHAVPFGPFLALGALEVLLAGEQLSRLYFSAMEKLLA